MPVYEIELLIIKLKNILENPRVNRTEEGSTLMYAISNWTAVLNTYRSHNDLIQPLFSAEALRYSDMVNTYDLFLMGGLSKEEVLKHVHVANNSDTSTAGRQFEVAFNQYSKACNQFPDSLGANSYLKVICADFDSKKWQSLYGAITAACPDQSSQSSSIALNPLTNSSLASSMCKEVPPPDAKFPNGTEAISTSQSMFSFLKDSSQYITFSSNSPMFLSWEGKVTDSMSFLTSLSYNHPNILSSTSLSGEWFSDSFREGVQSKTISSRSLVDIGKTSSKSHEYLRIVSMTLDDHDMGK